MMTREEFQKNLDIHGSQIEIWPGELVPKAQSALRADPSLALLLEGEEAFEATLRAWRGPTPPENLEAVVLQKTKSQPPIPPAPPPRRSSFAPLSVLVASVALLLVGTYVGFVLEERQVLLSDVESFDLAIFEPGEDLWEN